MRLVTARLSEYHEIRMIRETRSKLQVEKRKPSVG